MKKYYEAYEKRYQQVHEKQLSWASNQPSPIVLEILKKYAIGKEHSILELGCGEGRDCAFLLKQGYQVLGVDISEEAICFCKSQNKAFSDHFKVFDICTSELNETFDFIYSVAVIHMLVLKEDRDAFFQFIVSHLAEDGLALILTMGDGIYESESEIADAFQNVIRIHQETGKELLVANTSCKIVSFENFTLELQENGLELIEKGITEILPDFPTIMYGVVRKNSV